MRRRPMHVVIVDEELPYPLNSGKRIRSASLALHLAGRHQITYLCRRNADPAEARRASAFFHAHGIHTVLVEHRLPRKSGPTFYGRLVRNLFSPLPYSVESHCSAALRRAIRQFALAHPVDLWHCEWTPYAENLNAIHGTPWIVMAHNIESIIWQRYAENESNPLRRWYIRQQWRKFERFERRVFLQASRIVTVSDEDAALARERFDARRVEVVDNGVDTSYFRPETSARDLNRILFLGSLDWRPNLDAVRLLLEKVFPRVRAEEPSARLCLVGRRPPKWLVDRAGAAAGVELHSDVADVRPFLRRCAVMAVPLRIGGGSRLKILEALATECPVISTRLGAEGLHLTPGEHFVRVDDMAAMADALVQCLRDPRPVTQMARLARKEIVRRYDWKVLAEKLDDVWRAVGGSEGGRHTAEQAVSAHV